MTRFPCSGTTTAAPSYSQRLAGWFIGKVCPLAAAYALAYPSAGPLPAGIAALFGFASIATQVPAAAAARSARNVGSSPTTALRRRCQATGPAATLRSTSLARGGRPAAEGLPLPQPGTADTDHQRSRLLRSRRPTRAAT